MRTLRILPLSRGVFSFSLCAALGLLAAFILFSAPGTALGLSHKLASSCWSAPPKPMDSSWDIQKCKWITPVRPAGYNHMAPWVTAATGSGPTNPASSIEIDWMNVYGKNSSGQTVTLYSTASGTHGLDRNGQWGYRSLVPEADCPYNGQPSLCWFRPQSKTLTVSNMIASGDIARLTLNRSFGTDIGHLWNAGPHVSLPAGMTDVWVEARVRALNDARLHIGFDWWNDTTGQNSVEGASVTPFISGTTCNNEWVIISTPRQGSTSCNPVVNNSATPVTPGSSGGGGGGGSPSGQWTFNYTVTSAGTPSNMQIFRKNSSQGIWQQLPVTLVSGKTYRATAPSSGFSTSDRLVIQWKVGSTSYWACQRSGSTNKLNVSLSSTSPTGSTYSGYAVTNGSGCDVGLR